MRRLQWLWHRRRARKAPKFTMMLEIALPQPAQDWQHLAQVTSAVTLVDAACHPIEFILERAAPHPQFQPSVAVEINERSFAGDTDRLPVRRHHNGCTKPDA